jgi:hypothetical protein
MRSNYDHNRLWAVVGLVFCICPELRGIYATRIWASGWVVVPFTQIVSTARAAPQGRKPSLKIFYTTIERASPTLRIRRRRRSRSHDGTIALARVIADKNPARLQIGGAFAKSQYAIH